MIGLIKQSFYKSIGNGFLWLEELREIILDVEVTLKNRPLSYVEDHIELPILTPNALLYGRANIVPELEPQRIVSIDLRNRAKQLRRCKDTVWRRWGNEYLRGLRERHNGTNSWRSCDNQIG